MGLIGYVLVVFYVDFGLIIKYVEEKKKDIRWLNRWKFVLSYYYMCLSSGFF